MNSEGNQLASPRRIVPLTVDFEPKPAPPGWSWRLLTDLARLESGHTPSRDHPEWWGGEIPWIALPDIRALDGRIAFETSEHTNEQGIANSSARVLPAGTVVLSRTASVGFVTVMGRAMATSQDFVNWVCGPALDPHFLALLLRASRDYVRELSSGATHKTVYVPTVKAFRICLPPFREQQQLASRINNLLEVTSAVHSVALSRLNLALGLDKAYLAAAFPASSSEWPMVSLGDVGEIVSGITLGRRLNGTATRSVPYLRVANVKDGRLDTSDIYRIEATDNEIQKLTLRYGDLLLTEGGDADKLGRGTFWDDQLPECIHQNHIFRVRFDLDRFCPRFLAAQFASPYGKSYFLAHAKQTTGIATINQRVLAAFPLLAPPIEVQRRVASMLDARMGETAKLCRSLTSQLHAIEAIPGALLQRTFGVVEPRDSAA